jgi:hypothetical protein
MNEEDKKRFARYRKGYIPTLEDENEVNNSSNNKTTKIGFIENINVNMNVLVNDIIVNNTTKTYTK